jgi:hypothetical protein
LTSYRELIVKSLRKKIQIHLRLIMKKRKRGRLQKTYLMKIIKLCQIIQISRELLEIWVLFRRREIG